MFHMELFKASIASGANTPAQIAYYTTDNVLAPLNNGVQVSPSLPNIHSVFGVGAHLVEIRAQANSMLPFPWITLNPSNRGSAFESPPRAWDFSRFPVPMKPTEEFDIWGTQDSGGSETEYVAVQFCDGPPTPLPMPIEPQGLRDNPLMPGRFFTVHATATKTLSAGAWTQVQPTYDQALPAGYYGMLGARVYSATGLFFRMFPAMSPLWRPGGACVQSYDGMDIANQRFVNSFGFGPMGWGLWLSFYQNVPPQVEVFATSADTAEEFWFDLVYLGSQVQQGL